ncbi:MAG: hypothetical protein EAZ85_02035 [Bacteroidetes bacterium]|nr:MAG: hypothetical protein EAZ85_02035 [Bacteroidota bacterium]TAG86923.1 MAG: hypothetical protein EAZ20_11730 [Bacteroidota bacterium]
MTDLEFDILDELYFVQSYTELQEKLNFSDNILKKNLQNLIEKTWVKCFNTNREEIFEFNIVDFEKNFATLHYLATKEGLLQHNRI